MFITCIWGNWVGNWLKCTMSTQVHSARKLHTPLDYKVLSVFKTGTQLHLNQNITGEKAAAAGIGVKSRGKMSIWHKQTWINVSHIYLFYSTYWRRIDTITIATRKLQSPHKIQTPYLSVKACCLSHASLYWSISRRDIWLTVSLSRSSLSMSRRFCALTASNTRALMKNMKKTVMKISKTRLSMHKEMTTRKSVHKHIQTIIITAVIFQGNK